MSNQKDASGLTKQERHDIIIKYLQDINKPTKVFHLRWRPGDLLNGKILRSTPMFWYMKYQWSRAQIEEMFYKARIEIDPLFDSSLQQVFGGSPGPRWRGGVEIPKQKKWKMRAEENARQWQGQKADNIVSKENVSNAVNNYDAQTQQQQQQNSNRMKNKLAQNIGTKNREIWNAVSDFGADKSIDYKTFSDNLKDRGINVSPLLAKQLFDQLAGPSGKINRQEMDAIVRQLDRVKLPSDFASITWDDMNGKLGAQLVMKRVLLAASSGEPFNVDDFVFASKFGVNIQPIQFMNKLTDRDVEWDDRVRSMEAVSANIGTNPMFNNLLANTNIPELLCGWCTQMLDNKPEVQKTAVDLMPNIFHECLEKGDPQITVGHLEEILDNLFKVLDDPKCARNHAAAKDAIAKVVDDVINMQDPESVLYLAGLLSEKCDIENVTSAPARAFALEQIQKIMFGKDAPVLGTQPAKTGKLDVASLPKRGTVNREWLDIAAKKQTKPSRAMYSEPIDEYWGDDQSNIAGKKYRPQQMRHDEKEPPRVGSGPEEFDEGFPLDPAGPYAHVQSFPTNAMVNQPVKFDASKSCDCDNQPVKKYVWDFGDGSPQETTTGPYTTHPYKKAQVYPVTVVVTDKYGKHAQAGLNQRVNDPKNPLPPYAQLDSDPPTQHVRKPVKFDASKSHDGDKQPVVNYLFDFGDGSDKVSTPKPVVYHPYDKKGSYPVSVVVTDKRGQKAKASLTQRIIDPTQQDPTLPYAAVSSTPNDPKPKEPVKFDASKSVDCDGDPVRNYVWDFGDFSPKVTTTKPVVNHAYNKPGTYPVKVTVTDKYGKPATASCKTMVVPDPNQVQSIPPRLPPTVILKSNPQESVPMQPVYFDASDSHDYNGDPCVSFLWDFGDGSPKKTTTEPKTTHPYKESGTYNVKVIATDKFKQKGDATVNQRVREPGPEDPYAAVSSTPSDPVPSQPVRIDASESVDPKGNPCKNFVFDFGDGTPPVTSSNPVVNHAYSEPGTYPVNVTVTDKYGNKANASLTQRVKNPKQPTIGPPYAHLASKPKETLPYEPVDFDASKSHDAQNMPCKSFVWDFGDGTPKTKTNGPYTQHKYEKPGTYPVIVEVEDKHGQKATAMVNQRVGPDPEYNTNSNEPINRSKPAYASASWKNDPMNKFQNVAPVKKTRPARAQLIERHLPPYAGVRSTPTNAKPNEKVLFDASESQDYTGDPPVEYQWNFGDGTPTVATKKPKVEHAYKQPGSYPVQCTVVDKFGQKANASLTQRVKNPYKDIGPPYAALNSTPKETSPGQPVDFDASDSHDFEGKPCKSFEWDFGDGSPKKTTDVPRTQHPYQKTGTYPVTVTVTDKNNQKANASVSQLVTQTDPAYASAITPNEPMAPYAAVRATPNPAKPAENVTVDASACQDADGDPCKNFVFDFGDGTPPVTSTRPVVNHKYDKPGTYPVKCTVTDKNGIPAEATCAVRVNKPYGKPIGPPSAALESTPKETSPGQPVDFDASKSRDFEGKPCKQFDWDFGDGSPKKTTYGPRTQHPYQKTGSYPVTVTVTDKNNQKAKASVNQLVTSTDPAYASAVTPNDPMAPYSAVRATPSAVKPKENVTIDASASQDADGNPCKNFIIDFGDGTPPVTSTRPVVNHKYDKPGTYPVKCTVTDKNGIPAESTCTVRVNKPYGQSIGPPYAELQSQPKDTKPMEPVRFDASKSHDADKKPCKSFLWDFGDNSPQQTTKGPYINHPYQNPGTYPVTVTVTDKHGQNASASVNQRVTDEMKEDSAMKGKKYRSQQHADKDKPQYFGGAGPEEKMESNPPTNAAKAGLTTYYDPIDPYAALRSTPTNAKPNEQVLFDASDSQDADGDPPLEYQWNFGDGTPMVKTNKPFVNHAYAQPGAYPAKVTVVDKRGNPASASCTQRVINPQNPKTGPPYAALSSTPKETMPYDPVNFDASKSHDFENKPCKQFKWDFGDGTPLKTTTSPQTTHPYEKPGTYPVTVTAVDKYNQEAQATVSQRVTTPDPFGRNDKDPLAPPIAHLQGNPKTTVPKDPVEFDASQSHDMDGNPCVNFEWDFGDGQKQNTKGPKVKHPYQRIGHYPTTVTVTDKHGQKAKAHTNTEVTDSDPAKTSRIDAIRPPTAVLESDPKETLPNEPVDFDASKSKDMYNKPCVSFTWDFGDGSPQKTTKQPTTKHPYRSVGNYPVTVTVKDRNGLSAKASVNQRVSKTIPSRNSTNWDPIDNFQNVSPVKKSDPAYATFVDSVGPPFAALEGNPKVTSPQELVDFDASRSHDFQNQPCVEFTFDFGDGSPNVTQNSPFVKHPYQKIGHYPVSVTVKDKNGLTGKAHCNQKVTDSDPSRNNRIDQISPPYAHLIGDPPETKPNEPVNFDASKSKDMYDQPCVSYKWDFGDGSPNVTTKEPYTTHPYKQIGHYPVTVTVTDKNGLTGSASVNQKVTENIPPYSGGKKDPNPIPEFGRNDNEELKDEPPYNRMDPEEVGDEFRGVTSDAISKALMDPNRINSKKGKQMADVMKQLNPQWPDEELDPEAKKRYDRMNFPMRPHAKKLPPKPKIGIKAGKANVNEVDLGMRVDFGSFEVPDI